MDRVKIIGGKPLKGTVSVSGSKNAALPILISSLLTDQPCIFRRVPHLQDIRTVMNLLGQLGAEEITELEQNRVRIVAKKIQTLKAPMT